MSSSIHDKLNRVRKPRVHITYDVETEGAEIQRELPFVVGVMGDFSGDPTAPLKPLADRKFIQIDRDNFNEVMANMTPGLKLKVDNKLANDGTQMAVDLKFNSMDDFEPARVAAQVPAANTLITGLTLVTITFTTPVTNVNAADLLLNGTPALAVAIVTLSPSLR